MLFSISRGLKSDFATPRACSQVQDLTPSQLAIFKFLCLEPRTGLILAGDTAQTIARGTNFRFEVIRQVLF
jgi:hypothetical protein